VDKMEKKCNHIDVCYKEVIRCNVLNNIITAKKNMWIELFIDCCIINIRRLNRRLKIKLSRQKVHYDRKFNWILIAFGDHTNWFVIN
jgi:hypothetical protein